MLLDGNEHKALTYPEMMMYIDTDPTICLSRIGLRDRRGENKITLEELQRCESYHTTMFGYTKTHVRSIDTDQEVNGQKVNWIDTIIGWCQQISLGKEPDQLTSPIKENLGKRDWWKDCNSSETDLEREQADDEPRNNIEDLIEPIKIEGSQNENRNRLCLIKLKYGPLIYRFALPDWKLTNDRFLQEIERAWPELKNKEFSLSWKLIEKNKTGKCEDRDLNESLDYIELIDGNEVDVIMEYDIQLQIKTTDVYPPNNFTCNGTSDPTL